MTGVVYPPGHTSLMQEYDEDVGMKKAQKQDIHNGRIFEFLYPFLHSTQYYSHIIDGLWNVGMGIEIQIFFHCECLVSVLFSSLHPHHFLEENFCFLFLLFLWYCSYTQIPSV